MIAPALLLALNSLDGAGRSSPLGPVVAPKLKFGDFYRRFVTVDMTLTGATGGSTDADIELTLQDHQGNQLDKTRQVRLRFSGVAYSPLDADLNANVSVTALTGTVVAQGNGWAVIQTDATGYFNATLVNATDETVQVSVETAPSVSVVDEGCVVIASPVKPVSWAA